MQLAKHDPLFRSLFRLLHISVAALLSFSVASALASKGRTDGISPVPSVASGSYITYVPVSQGRIKPECARPFSLQIFETGRVIYNGHSCVRELGRREFEIPQRTARSWIRRLINAGFMKLPADLTGGLQDSGRLILRLSHGTDTNEVMSTTSFSQLPQEVQRVVKELRETIDPVNRWACIPGEWPNCTPLDTK